LALALVMPGCGSGKESPAPVVQSFKEPHLQGTFISRNVMADGDWRAGFSAMRAAGLTQAVVNHAVDASAGTARYPTALPGLKMVYATIPLAFPNADLQGIEVYLGLQSSEDWWSLSTDPDWLASQAALANKIADELWSLYGSQPSFKGWYLPFEADNVTFPTQVEWDLLAKFYAAMATHLHAIAPGKPVIIAPFFNPNAGGLDSAGWREMWASILKKAPIDIIALQDGVGAGNTTLADLPEWFQATKGAIADSGSKCLLWSDTETFNIADWSTMPIGGLVADMKAVKPFVSNMISWSFNDYLDPHRVNPNYYDTYRQYAETGALDAAAPSTPSALKAQVVDSANVTLTWTGSVDGIGVVAYDIIRNGAATRAYGTKPVYGDTGLEPNTEYTYAVAAVDAAGNVSAPSNTQVVTTPVDPVYDTNLALGLPYTTTSPADPGHPDPDGKALTDGVFGANDPWDAAWQGRTNGGNTWTLDLGSVQTVHEVNSDWLHDEPDYIQLPQSVLYEVSVDGTTYQPVGTATRGIVGSSIWHKVFKVIRLDVQARYVRVTATTDDGSWSFIDEIEVRQ
jgi:predicted enzyme related to lactoylglutathione lyase